IKSVNDELKALRTTAARSRAHELLKKNVDGVVVKRVDDLSANDLRELATAIRADNSIRVVVLGGVAPTGGVALVAALGKNIKASAADLIRDAARLVGGGGGGKGDIATAGGKNATALDEALRLAAQAAKNIS
ncbi:MAG: DHHA1 domain-containing protein, partial [Actinomycetota bacterium]